MTTSRPFFGRFQISRLLGLSFKLGLTIAAFWFALKDVDFAHLTAMLETQRISGLAEAALLVVTQIMLGAFRWRMVLAVLTQSSLKVLPALTALRLYYISIFFNCCLPGTVGGDVIRVWLAKSERIPLSTAIHSVVIDRLIALIALGLLVLLTMSSLGSVVGFDSRYWVPAALMAVGAGVWLLPRIAKLLAPYGHIRPVHWLLQFLDCLRVMLTYPKTSLLSLLCAVLSHLAFCLCAYALAQSLNIELTLLQCITLVPLVLVITTIPVSIGGWGVREAGMVGLLGLVGVSQAGALMLSVELGFIVIAVSLPAAGLWLLYRRRAGNDSD